jgi:hypothetical protein
MKDRVNMYETLLFMSKAVPCKTVRFLVSGCRTICLPVLKTMQPYSVVVVSDKKPFVFTDRLNSSTN